MTANEKSSIAKLLDLSDDFLRTGYHQGHAKQVFTDDAGPNIQLQTQDTGDSLENDSLVDDSLEKIAQEVSLCSACPLATTRKKTVPGEGVDRPLVLVIGEGPGADEDTSGRPFVGKAGQLLDKMLASIDLSRDKNCFIGNLVKCRPPNNRDPSPEETAACAPFLARQLALLKPKAILSVGRVPTQALLSTTEGIGKLRGRFTAYKGIPFLPTYHPSALLRDETLKRPAWEDLKTIKSFLDDQA